MLICCCFWTRSLCMSCSSAGVLSEMEGESTEGHRQQLDVPGSPCCAAAIVQQGLSAHLGHGGGIQCKQWLNCLAFFNQRGCGKGTVRLGRWGEQELFPLAMSLESDKQVCSLACFLWCPHVVSFVKVLYFSSSLHIECLPYPLLPPQSCSSHVQYAEYSKFVAHVVLLSEKQPVLSQCVVTFLVFHRHLCLTLLHPEENSPFVGTV